MDHVLRALRRRFPGHGWDPVRHGRSGAGVWRLTGDPGYYAKVAARSPHPDSGFDLTAEADRLAWLAGTGIPAPAVLEAGADDDCTWLVTTAVPGRSAEQPWPAGQLDGLVDAVADVTRALHALPVADCPFDRGLAVTVPHAHEAVAAGLVDLDDLDDERQGWNGPRLLAELAATRPATEERVVCHGDLSLPNVVVDPETLTVTGLIDVGRLGAADRYADLALITRSLGADYNSQFAGHHADRFLARYGEHPADPARLAFYRLLDEFC